MCVTTYGGSLRPLLDAPLHRSICDPISQTGSRAHHAKTRLVGLRSIRSSAYTKGASGAGVFKLTVDGRNYLLRIEGPSDGFRDPYRQYACLRIAAEAAVAPRLIYAGSKEGDSHYRLYFGRPDARCRMEQTRTRPDLNQDGQGSARGASSPLWSNYLEGVGSLMSSCLATGILPARALEKHRRYFAELVKAYPGKNGEKAISFPATTI